MSPPRRGVPRGFHSQKTTYDNNGYFKRFPSKSRPSMPRRWENRYIPNHAHCYIQNRISPVSSPTHNDRLNNYTKYDQFDPYWKSPPHFNENFSNDQDFSQSFFDHSVVFNATYNNFAPCNENIPKVAEESNATLDKSLCDTIDTVKRKLQEKKLGETSIEDDNVPFDDPLSPTPSYNKITSEKKRIEHSKMSPKLFNMRRDDKKDETRVKLKSATATQPDKIDTSRKSQTLRRNILKQLFKMNNNNLRQILSNPESSVKYNFALASLIKDTRNTLSKELRNVAEKSLKFHNISADTVQGEKIVRDAFLGHLGTMLDTDASLELFNMEPQLIRELSKVLQEDLMDPVNDDISVRNLADVMHENITDEELDTHGKNDDQLPLNEQIVQCKEEISDAYYLNNDSDFESVAWDNYDGSVNEIKTENVSPLYDHSDNNIINEVEVNLNQLNVDDVEIKPSVETNSVIETNDSIIQCNKQDDNDSNLNAKVHNDTNDNIYPLKYNVNRNSNKNKNKHHTKVAVIPSKKKLKRKNKKKNKNLNNSNFSIRKNNDNIKSIPVKKLHSTQIEEFIDKQIITTERCINCVAMKNFRDDSTQCETNYTFTSTQTDSKTTSEVSSQTDDILFDNANHEDRNKYNPNKINTHRGVVEQMKNIDGEIQNLLREKFRLYELLDKYTCNNSSASEAATNDLHINKDGQRIFSALENKIITHIASKKTKCVEITYSPPFRIKKNLTETIPTEDRIDIEDETGPNNVVLKKKYNLRNCSIQLPRVDLNTVKRKRMHSPRKVKCNRQANENTENDSIITFKRKSVLDRHEDSIIAIEIIMDNILVVSLDGNMYYYDGATETLLNTTKCYNSMTCICIGKNKNIAYTGSFDSYLRCYNFETGISTLDDVYIGTAIQSMCMAWDILYIGTRSGYISQFNTITDTLITNVPIKFTDDAVLAIHAIKEGPRKVLLVGSRSQNITINDANSGLLLRTFNGSTATVYSLLFHSGNVLCGTSLCKIEIFDFVTGDLVGTHDGGQGATCLKMYKGLLFAGCYDGLVYVFEPSVVKPLATIPGNRKIVLSMAILNERVIVGYGDKSLLLWSIPKEIQNKMTT